MSKYFHNFVSMSRHKFSNTDPICYVYRHIRLDKNVPFYVGIGTDNGGYYRRAHNKVNRNRMWKGVSAKTTIEVEIIAEGLIINEAWKKEKEFIALHKRKMDGGTLVNITLGGDGFNGVPLSDETRKKMSLAKKGKPSGRKGQKMPQAFCEKISRSSLGRPAWNKGKPWPESFIKQMSESRKGKMVGDKHPMYGKKMPGWLKEKLRSMSIGRAPWNAGKKMDPGVRKLLQWNYDAQKKKVLQFNLNWELVEEYSSLNEAAKKTGYPKSSIGKCCAGYTKECKGFLWEYKSNKV
jgi:hypothetical protein